VVTDLPVHRPDRVGSAEPTQLLLDVFAAVPHVMVCVKANDGRYVGANIAFVRRAGRRHVDEVLGRRAGDLFSAQLAASYEAQDRALASGQRSVRNQLEVIADVHGDSRWYLTTKVMAQSVEHGDVIVAVSVDAGLGDGASDEFAQLRAAIEVAHASVPHGVRVGELARAAGMSTDRLERAMRRVLGESPKQYLLRLRAEHAATLLVTTNRSLSEIAADSSYYDQAQFTRQFRAHIGTTPREYRRSASTAIGER
jgi:AraC-like DNA-binding protein